MLENVQEFINSKKLIDKGQKVLIGVSGGRDSVVLLYVLNALGYDVEVAHCNYHLRGEESDKDALFVRHLSAKLEVPFHDTSFDTKKVALERGISVQMAARDLRYAWFEDLKKSIGAQRIAIAHHLDDQLETILINITRGTGIKGLRGMKEKRGDVVRPLLSVSRDDINQYVYENHISFREDSSNASGKYFRNKIRHQIIPVLKEINPSLFKAVSNTTGRLRNVEEEWETHFAKWEQQLVIEGDKTIIPYSAITGSNHSFIQQYLRSKGFSYPDIESIIKAVGEKGKKFYGKNHWILVSAEVGFELCAEKVKDHRLYYLDEVLPISLDIQLENQVIPDFSNPNRVYLNADKVQGRLHLRKWKEGDWFIPFGMYGKQKLSDYFVNNKFSLADKEAVWLLCDNEKVVWIVGHRMDNRYRIDENTRNTFVIELKS